mgnify:CR=1 FL=1
MRHCLFAILLAFPLAGCVADMPDDGPVVDDRQEGEYPPHGDHDVVGDEISEEELLEIVPKAGGCGQRWQLPPSVAAAGRRQSVSYNSAGSQCSGGATSGARELGSYIKNNFNQINRSVPGGGVQMYNCRQVRGGGSLSVHSVGRALDVFIPTRNGGANNQQGDQLSNWLVQNAEHIGVQMIIWDRTIWYPGSRGERCYGGSHPHNDHIHIELTNDAANRRTAFFRGGGQPQDVPETEQPPPSSAWIGSACRTDAECNFSHEGVRAQCNKQRNPNLGVCTIACAGYCPDRQGEAQTFCASRDDLGGSGGAGFCLAKSSGVNDSCTRHAGFTEVQVDRYVGRTRAPSRRDEVCAPVLVNNRPPEPNDPPEPEDRGGLLCGQPGLELSDHGERCDAGENVWRCACSGNYGVTISQVCRSGRWTTYHTSPRSCASCSGRYSSACD